VPETASLLSDVEVHGYLAAPRPDGRPVARDDARLTAGPCEGFTFAWAHRAASGPAALASLNPAFRFTSGTTAQSKGVVLSHEATLARVESAARVLRFTEDDCVLWVLPLAYHFAVNQAHSTRVDR
jgi:acyl-CoA synthetase (AMP-forming)/AMP-acid ligase II